MKYIARRRAALACYWSGDNAPLELFDIVQTFAGLFHSLEYSTTYRTLKITHAGGLISLWHNSYLVHDLGVLQVMNRDTFLSRYEQITEAEPATDSVQGAQDGSKAAMRGAV